jgi:hypothetical protein
MTLIHTHKATIIGIKRAQTRPCFAFHIFKIVWFQSSIAMECKERAFTQRFILHAWPPAQCARKKKHEPSVVWERCRRDRFGEFLQKSADPAWPSERSAGWLVQKGAGGHQTPISIVISVRLTLGDPMRIFSWKLRLKIYQSSLMASSVHVSVK